jgi:hypothetical protein
MSDRGRHIGMNHRITVALVSVCLMGSAPGCGSELSPTDGLVQTVTYESGAAVRMEIELPRLQLSDSGVLVLESIGDGRCPAEVNCVWEGDVTGLFRVGSLDEMNQLVETDGILQTVADGSPVPVHSLSGTPETFFELDGVRYQVVATELIVDGSDRPIGLEVVVTTL